MLNIIAGLIHLVLNIYKLLVIIYFLIGLIKVPANKWTELLGSIIEPVLAPIRKLLAQYLPKNWQVIDWSPVALFLLLSIVQWLL